MGAKGWIIFSVIAVGLLGALIYFSGQSRVDVSAYNLDEIIGANEHNGNIADHVKGNEQSSVVLIEYGDFQCPGCASVNPDVNEIVQEYEEHLAFVFRNKPLPEIHPNARFAAAAAEAAHRQGKYWQMHGALYANQAEWAGVSSTDRATAFETYARSIGLNVKQFNEDIASESISQKINFDLAISREKNVSSTPSFFLNGEQLTQEVWGDKAAFEEAIREAIKASGVELEDKEVTEEGDEATKENDN